MTTNLFVYGTLQNKEIVEALTDKQFKQEPGLLEDYKVLHVKGVHYQE